MSLLPTRDRESENAFLRSLQPYPIEETILELVEEAIKDRRIQLAAKLVQLIPYQENESAIFTRARKAANFLLLHPEHSNEEELYDSWMEYKQRKHRKAKKQRMRPKSPFNRRRPR